MKRATEDRQKNPFRIRPAHTPKSAASWSGMAAALAASVVLVGAISACAGGAQPPAASTPAAVSVPASGASQDATPAAAVPTATPAAAVPTATATAAGDPATAALKQTVTDVLGRLAAGTPKPATAQLADALTGAGIPAAALEVSESRTPTGLEADAVEAAVMHGKDCVVGQIRDGAVTVTVLPVLAGGKCFVGSPA